MSKPFRCKFCHCDLIKMAGQKNTKKKKGVRIKSDYYFCEKCKRIYTTVLKLIRPILIEVSHG